MGWVKHPISQVRSTGEWGAELWPLMSDLPPPAGIRAAATRSAAEHEVRISITRRRRKSPGGCGAAGAAVAAGPCKPSAGPTRRLRGGPDAARAPAGTGLLIWERVSISRPVWPGMRGSDPATIAARVSDPAETADRKVFQCGSSHPWVRVRTRDDVSDIGVEFGVRVETVTELQEESEYNRWASMAGMRGRSGGVRNLMDEPRSATAGHGSS